MNSTSCDSITLLDSRVCPDLWRVRSFCEQKKRSDPPPFAFVKISENLHENY